jgi:hypothetical protein
MPATYSHATGNVTVSMESVECAKCGVSFCMPRTWVNHFRDNGQTFYCPAGHPNFYGETLEDRLKKKLVSMEHQKKWAEDDARYARSERDRVQKQLSASKGQATKLRKRISHGVCPCCHRTFKQLSRHMEAIHPEYGKEPTP